jgi:predicted protein tyrosine phosphatase
MIKTVKAISYQDMKDYLDGRSNQAKFIADKHDSVWLISITDPNVLPIVKLSPKSLPLQFHDADPGPLPTTSQKFRHIQFFDMHQARKIANFIVNAQKSGDSNDILLVNCMAGISRSGAIADTARALLSIDYQEFKNLNPQIIPNRWVKGLLFKAFEEILG